MRAPATVTYAFDAYCGWCYGFSPALHAFVQANDDRIKVRVRSGGLFTDDRALPLTAYPHIPEANARIAKLTGVCFGEAYATVLAEGTTVMNSADAASGLVALRRQDNTRALEAAQAMQRAWYVDGRSLSDPQVYRDIADALGLDGDAVATAYADPSTRVEAKADFDEVRRFGVDSYPTLLLHTQQGLHRLGGPASSAHHLTQALDEYLAAAA